MMATDSMVRKNVLEILEEGLSVLEEGGVEESSEYIGKALLQYKDTKIIKDIKQMNPTEALIFIKTKLYLR